MTAGVGAMIGVARGGSVAIADSAIDDEAVGIAPAVMAGETASEASMEFRGDGVTVGGCAAAIGIDDRDPKRALSLAEMGCRGAGVLRCALTTGFSLWGGKSDFSRVGSGVGGMGAGFVDGTVAACRASGGSVVAGAIATTSTVGTAIAFIPGVMLIVLAGNGVSAKTVGTGAGTSMGAGCGNGAGAGLTTALRGLAEMRGGRDCTVGMPGIDAVGVADGKVELVGATGSGRGVGSGSVGFAAMCAAGLGDAAATTVVGRPVLPGRRPPWILSRRARMASSSIGSATWGLVCVGDGG
ncbi:hypothetical protein [Dechloromonas sp. ZS-1]|uniref:hypothetical protein n=1 Tax=Dechloromonas sp. ZS-1 TaxID=3138067 RepID=UPI0031FDECFE